MSDDALSEMDAWCVKRMARLSEQMHPYIMAGGSLEDPQYRQQLGEHRAYMAMRSFIHGCRSEVARLDWANNKPFTHQLEVRPRTTRIRRKPRTRPMQSDPVFTTREELEAWEETICSRAYLDNPRYGHIPFVIQRVRAAHVHLTKDSDNAE